jgi:hypothetical protein
MVRLGLLVAAVLLLGAAPGFAQTLAPSAQIDNHANGFAYQPTEAQMKTREEAAGVGPDQQQEQQEGQTLLQLDHKLLGKQLMPPGTQAPK